MNAEKRLHLVLAGHANVGKSVIFNYLTGLHQHIGNWPGKTVEKAEGTLHYKGYTVDVLDLPGIYSLSTYSIEELISREYIAFYKPDLVVNVVDVTHIESNLIFTLQLLELGRPVVLVLNMVDLLKRRGLKIDIKKLGDLLGVPVVPVVAIHGKGITKILSEGIELLNNKLLPKPLKYGGEVEREIEKLTMLLKDVDSSYPKRWLALKVLEKDEEISGLTKTTPKILEEAEKSIIELEKIHKHDSSIVIAGERCQLAARITSKVLKIIEPSKPAFIDRLDYITSHKLWGYPIMAAVIALMFCGVFKFGEWLSSILERITSGWQTAWQHIFGASMLASLGWAAIESSVALAEIALPYIIPFYFILYLLEDCGYLARIAYLMDSLMHKLGVHGKAIIPLVLGYGCNVPGCLSCRIMETQRERFITGFLVTLVPCSAVTVVILGLVGKYVGMSWVLGLYLFNLLVIFSLGKLAFKILPGEPTELIMEMPDYKRPQLKTILLETWFKLKDFLFVAGPFVVVSGIIIQGLYFAGWLTSMVNILSPITVKWLNLPAITGILLGFGILRKELILVMLAALFNTSNFSLVMNSEQMITMALVSMFYIPCIATIVVLKKEFGWRKALGITILEIAFALLVGGVGLRFLRLIKFIPPLL